MSIPLPPIPDMYFDTWPLTPEKLRARDQEIARVVLEAAAKVCEQWDATHPRRLATAIRALEFKHE